MTEDRWMELLDPPFGTEERYLRVAEDSFIPAKLLTKAIFGHGRQGRLLIGPADSEQWGRFNRNQARRGLKINPTTLKYQP